MDNSKINIDFEIIWRKIHTSLSEKEEIEFNRWLTQDERNYKYFEDAKNFYEKKNQSNFNENSTEAWNIVSGKITVKDKKSHSKRWLYYSSVAASILVFISVYLFWPQDANDQLTGSLNTINPGTNKATLILDDGSTYYLSTGKNIQLEENGSQITSQGTSIHYSKKKSIIKKLKFNSLKVPRGGEFFITLSDSTKVWLNSETILRYPVNFLHNERRVELIGEAFFEVKKDIDKPFVVITDDQVVEVLGTSFNIRSYESDSLIFTTLVEGKVEVFHKNSPDKKQTLQPSFQSLLFKNDGMIYQRKIEADQYIAWRDGRFSFIDQPLEEMMNTLSRWYNVDIIFDNEKARTIKFTGNLKRYENFENILSLIEKTNEVKFAIEDRTIHIQ